MLCLTTINNAIYLALKDACCHVDVSWINLLHCNLDILFPRLRFDYIYRVVVRGGYKHSIQGQVTIIPAPIECRY